MKSPESLSGTEREQESDRVYLRHYFFRHGQAQYGEGVAELLRSFGYGKEHTTGHYGESGKSYDEKKRYYASPARRKAFARRGSVQPLPESVPLSNVEAEGSVEAEVNSWKTLESVRRVLQQENNAPFLLIGPRTRHGQTAEAIADSLEKDGVTFDERSATVTDMLTDYNHHWVYLLEVAGEYKTENPWNSFFAGELSVALKKKGLETMDDVTERMRHFLHVTERLLNIRKTQQQTEIRKVPALINVTSDFNQLGILRALGIEHVGETPVNDFRPAPGSFIEIEERANDTADVYYQGPEDEEPLKIATVADYSQRIGTRKP